MAESKIIQDEYIREREIPAKSGRSEFRPPNSTPSRLLRTPLSPEGPLIRGENGLKCSVCGCDKRMLCIKCRKGGYCAYCSVTLLLER